MKPIYIGFFLDNKIQNTLPREILHQHITFSYMPENEILEKAKNVLNEKATFRCISYGNNGKNEGYKVELVKSSDDIAKLFAKIPIPHITTGLGYSGKAVDTAYLNFRPCEVFEVNGTFGFFCSDQKVHF